MAATFPAAVDLLYERGQVLQTLPSSLFKEEQLQDRRIDEDVGEKCLYSNDSCCRLDLKLGLVKKKKFQCCERMFFQAVVGLVQCPTDEAPSKDAHFPRWKEWLSRTMW